VILSTHIVSDVEAVATEIVILDRGHMRRHCSPEKLLQTVVGKVWLWVVPSAALHEIRAEHLVSNVVHRSDGVHVRMVVDEAPAAEAQPVEPSLEDAYLYNLAKDRKEASI
jgi:ABC-2 type transport system ATP-binding protein